MMAAPTLEALEHIDQILHNAGWDRGPEQTDAPSAEGLAALRVELAQTTKKIGELIHEALHRLEVVEQPK